MSGLASSGKDIKGKRFDALVAIKPTENRINNSIVWQLQCDCGNKVERSVAGLHNLNQSCGCKNKNVRLNLQTYNERLKKEYKNIVCLKFKNNSSKAIHECGVHGIFHSSPTSMLTKTKKVKHGCPKCSQTARIKAISKCVNHAIDKIFEKHGDKIKLKSHYTKIADKLMFICYKGHVWKTPLYSVMRGTGCFRCNSKASSKLEQQWLRLIKKHINPNVNFTAKHSSMRIHLPSSKIGLIPDGYDPVTKTVYEFYGDYWHGNLNKKDYTHNGLTKKELNVKTRKREKELLQAGYKVVYCWESDFKRYLKRKFHFCPVPFTEAILDKKKYSR